MPGQGAIASSADEMFELMARDEDMDPEFEGYVQRLRNGYMMLNHPLVQTIMFNPKKAALQNRQLKHKRELAAEALAKKQYHSYVFLHERPYRAHALTVVRATATDEQHHELIASVWTDSENIRQSQRDWIYLLKKLPDPHLMMTEGEREALAKMQGKFWVWRGLRNPRYNKLGISWTIDRAKAEWFARRYRLPDTQPAILHGYVARSDVLAYFTGRNESEIVVLPEKVKRRRLEYLGAKDDEPE